MKDVTIGILLTVTQNWLPLRHGGSPSLAAVLALRQMSFHASGVILRMSGIFFLKKSCVKTVPLAYLFLLVCCFILRRATPWNSV